MKTECKTTNIKHITIIKIAILILIIMSGILYVLFLHQNFLRQSITLIGELSNNPSMGDAISLAMGSSNTESYEVGLAVLTATGYQSIYPRLFSRQQNSVMTWIFLCVLISLSGAFFFICIREASARESNVRGLARWIRSNHQVPPSLPFVPSPIIVAVSELKDCIVRQEILHQEDNTRIINYMEDISHQLKTPLAVIQVACERTAIGLPSTSDAMKTCLTQVQKITDMIRDLLLLGRFDCGRLRMEFNYISADELIEMTINDHDLLAEEKGLSITVQGEPKIQWFCDAFWIKEALGNILKNCIEHSSNGEIVVSYKSDSLGNYITVTDCGCGFQEGCEAYIFDRYSFGNRTSREGGGLGLSIAQQVLRLHFGTISASNRDCGGTEFFLSFPRLNPETVYDREAVRGFN